MLRDALAAGAARLAAAGCPSPEVDARLLAAHLLGVPALSMDRWGPAPAGFDELIERRVAREPLQHITGSAAFGHLDLAVGPGVFIPRPETELLADWAVTHAKRRAAPVVVDLCTGSGAIAQYVASMCPDATVVGVDASASALEFARRNAPDVTLVQADVRELILPELHGRVDVVVSNPPYVPLDDGLEPEVYHDPPEAVFSGADGMDLIRAFMPLVVALAAPGAVVGVEHDDSTSAAVVDTFRDAGLVNVEAMTDLAGRPRFVTAAKV
ncbi:peptide chain release factor N(5)-glutamine methyltransferase [Corynebacterium uterequi]|uniref:peptide chain release factor N(5)-glutamine methyltransferase n=1 Tax=Corynebacterium uterequi TaxID=1072256 RepID=UPI0038B23BB3